MEEDQVSESREGKRKREERSSRGMEGELSTDTQSRFRSFPRAEWDWKIWLEGRLKVRIYWGGVRWSKKKKKKKNEGKRSSTRRWKDLTELDSPIQPCTAQHRR